MQSVNQFPHSVTLPTVSDPARCAVLGLKSTAVGLGERNNSDLARVRVHRKHHPVPARACDKCHRLSVSFR